MFPGVERAPAAPSARTPHDTVVAEARAGLVAILKLAYSGELAAALAYNGHWRSVRDPADRARLKDIEAEELQHRAWVGEMLEDLGEWPDARRERKMAAIGRTIAFLCRISGWLIPMYGAGRLESPGRRIPLWTLPPPRETIRRKWAPDAKDKSAVS